MNKIFYKTVEIPVLVEEMPGYSKSIKPLCDHCKDAYKYATAAFVKATIAVENTEDGKAKSGIALCSVEDEYSKTDGEVLASTRAINNPLSEYKNSVIDLKDVSMTLMGDTEMMLRIHTYSEIKAIIEKQYGKTKEAK